MKQLKKYIYLSLLFLLNFIFLSNCIVFSSQRTQNSNANFCYEDSKNNENFLEKNAISNKKNQNLLKKLKNVRKNENINSKSQTYKMAIVIDDFGSFDQSGVKTLLDCGVPLTCAVIPNVDNTNNNISEITKKGHELILHMPMQAHVNLPESWYGPIYIKTYDSPETVYEKLNRCLRNFPEIKGFNIHIGSGVSKNKELMKVIYTYAKEHNLYFLDSRTIITNATEEACKETNSIYLGRDVFLEADKNKSYAGVCYRLTEGANIAKQKGYSIVIGHVGAEGGENTAKAICDSLEKIKNMGVEIVPLSEIYQMLKEK